MSATKSLLEKVHQLLAQDMLNRLEGPDTMTAPEWSAVIKFLKDNNIEAILTQDEQKATAFNLLVNKATATLPEFRQ